MGLFNKKKQEWPTGPRAPPEERVSPPPPPGQPAPGSYGAPPAFYGYPPPQYAAPQPPYPPAPQAAPVGAPKRLQDAPLPTRVDRFCGRVKEYCKDLPYSPVNDREFGQILPWELVARPDLPTGKALGELVRKLSREFGPKLAGSLAADTFFNPTLVIHQDTSFRYGQPNGLSNIRGTIFQAAAALIVASPPPDLYARIKARLTFVLHNPYFNERQSSSNSRDGGLEPPRQEELIALALALPPTMDQAVFLQDIMDNEVEHRPHARDGSADSNGVVQGNFVPYMPGRALSVLEVFFLNGVLTYEWFFEAVRRRPMMMNPLTGGRGEVYLGEPATKKWNPEFWALMMEWKDRALEEFLANPTPEALAALHYVSKLRGTRWLLEAARLHAQLHLDRLVLSTYPGGSAQGDAVIHLAGTTPDPSEPAQTAAQIAEKLKAYPAGTLKRLLPHADAYRDALVIALGWQAAAPLIEIIMGQPPTGRWLHPALMDNDDAIGADGDGDDAIPSAVETAGEPLAKEVIALYRSARIGRGTKLMSIEATAGWVSEDIMIRIGRQNQRALLHYAAVPVKGGAEEVAERYLTIQNFFVESRQYGNMRRESSALTTDRAEIRLAKAAGYGDLVKLEWAIEGTLAHKGIDPGRTITEGVFKVQTRVSGTQAVIEAFDSGKRLDPIPADLRHLVAWREAEAAHGRLNAKVARFRTRLESMMKSEERVSKGELDAFATGAIGKEFAARLVFQTDTGAFGWYDPASRALRGADGMLTSAFESVAVAHPLHLARAGKLKTFQEDAVHRKLVQPFKQVFRESYELGKADAESRTKSRRLAGRKVNALRASAALEALGWKYSVIPNKPGDDSTLPTKAIPAAGLKVRFKFPDATGVYAQAATITADALWFEPMAGGSGPAYPVEDGCVPLASVPPVLFSEAIRDGDLVVWGAAADEKGGFSPEGFAQRGDLVRAVAAQAGAPAVEVDGRYAKVQGKLGTYRVDLANGSVLVGPNNYRCLVHEDAFDPRKVYLPFAEPDWNEAEVIGKVLMFAADDKITDRGILAQIRAASGRSS